MSKRLLVVGNLAKDIIDGMETYGGSATNLALAAKRLGIDTGIMSVLGKDSFSRKYKKFLKHSAVDIRLTLELLNQLPVCTVVSRENAISSSIWQDNDCHSTMSKMPLNNELIREYDLVHLVSCPPELASRIASLGVMLSYEPGPMLVEDHKYFDGNVAASSSYIFLNKEEYEVVKNDIHELLTDKTLTHKIILIVTLGKEGVRIYDTGRKAEKHIKIPAAVVVKNVVNSIGAGDNFKAGFLAGYLRSRTVEDSVQIGIEMGSEVVKQSAGILDEKRVAEIKLKYNL